MTTPPRLRLALWFVGLVAVAAALPGVGVRATYGAHTTADEPHYLLTALSLAEDGDLDVADELADERWRAFHEVGLPIQERVLGDGSQRAPHDPLLPALLALPMALGGWVAAKASLALVAAALAALTTWTAVRRFGVSVPVAAGTIGALAVSWPLSAYGTQVYPELPAALATVGVVAVGTAPGAPTTRRVLALAALLTVLPWLAVKYAPVGIGLAGVVAWRWWRDGHRRSLLVLGGVLAASGAAYLGLHQRWYGGWTVYAAADHFVDRGGEFAVVGFDPQPFGRARRLVGLLVGRDFGLAVWQPAYLLTVPALAVLARRRPPGWSWLAVPLALGWLNATFVALTMQGWWVPGRQVVVVLPLVALALAWWLDAAARGWRIAAAVLGTLGVITSAWLVVDGLAGRLTWVVDFGRVGDPLLALRRSVLPDYLDVTGATWAWQAAWVVVLVAAAVVARRGTPAVPDVRDGPRGQPASATGDSVPVASRSSSPATTRSTSPPV